MFKLLYSVVTILWLIFCYFGTSVSLSYNTDWPIAPQVWQGIYIAVFPPVLIYLTVFHLIPWLAPFFKGRSLF